MPQCVVEYAKSLELRLPVSSLLGAVTAGVDESKLFDMNKVNVRALAFDQVSFVLGRGEFINVTMRILSGRTPRQKKSLTASVLVCLKTLNLDGVPLTVEVVDIDKATHSMG